jgi:hypothetical protein
VPFVRYDAIRLTLDAYEESGGPFPASFAAIKETLEITRAGAAVSAALSETVAVHAEAALARRMSGHLPGISGEVAGIGAFALSGPDLDRNWVEANVDLNWRATPDVNVRFSLGASTDGDTAADFSGMVGVDIRL